MKDLMIEQINLGNFVSAVVHHHKVFEKGSYENRSGVSLYTMAIQAVLLFVPIAILAPFTIARAIKREQPDVLHLHFPNASCFWLLFILSARKIPWVIHWHSDVLGERPHRGIKFFYPFYRFFEQKMLNHSKKIIVTSPNYQTTSKPLEKWQAKCAVVPLGVKLDVENPQIEHAKGHNSRSLTILCVGRLTYYKGHAFLIDAVLKALAAGVNVKLHLVGKGDLYSSLLAKAKQSPYSDSILFHGHLSDDALDQLLTETDLVCLPSIERTEAFGLVLLEAMRKRKACIVTNVKGSGMSYVVDHMKTGMVVESENTDALFKAFYYCSQNPSDVIEWGNMGYEKLHTQFDLKHISEKIQLIYQNIYSS